MKIFDSAEFDAFECIDHIRRNTENIGIHQYLVRKLRTCKYDELEFLIPQLVQLLVAFETESMALEDLLIDYSKQYPHFSLIVFWSLQAYVFELRNDPESYSFQTLRRFINKLQGIIFNAEMTSTQPPKSEFRENLKPSLVLCGMAAASMALPQINEYASPLIISQGRQQKSFVFRLANFQKALTKNLTLKNQRISTEVNALAASDDERLHMHHSTDISRVVTSRPLNDLQRSSSLSRLPSSRKISSSLMQLSDGDSEATDDDSLSLERHAMNNHEGFSKIEESLNINTVIKSKKSLRRSLVKGNLENYKTTRSSYGTGTAGFGSQSMPDLTHNDEVSTISPYLSPAESDSSIFQHGGSVDNDTKKQSARTASKSNLDAFQLLRINYAKKETDFIMSLQNISLRLSQVPKEARLSALRAELSIINRNELPSQIDIPQLLPVTSNKNKKYHKILKLNVNEACVLNSAERVPFLLLIEYLSDEMDFNPYSDENQQILQATAKMNDGAFGLKTAVENVSGSKRSSLEEMGITRPIDYGEADLSDMKTVYEKSILNLTASRVSTPVRSGLILQSRLELPAIPLGNTDVTTKVLADQMRIASVMLQQLESSGLSSSEQALAIKKRIVESMQSLQNQFDSIDYEKIVQLGGNIHNAGERKLENDVKLGEDWNAKKIRIRKTSVYGHLRNWELCSVIVKNGDDLPQEAFACQLITMISNIWKSKGIDAWTKRMKILITSANAGLVETITNAISIHSIKKSLTEISISQGDNLKGRIFTLSDYFERLYGHRESFRFRQAQNNFASSLASYSIICYILQIKDRHNGNIMLDDEGHIIHIDFGFLLSNSPGSLGFEGAPFKLTTEYVEVLGGIDSPAFQTFKSVCKACFSELRKNSDQIINMVELMQKDSSLPCFKNGENTSVLLKQRFQLQLSDEESDLYVENTLIGKSLGSVYTRLYDQFQMITQGIYS